MLNQQRQPGDFSYAVGSAGDSTTGRCAGSEGGANQPSEQGHGSPALHLGAYLMPILMNQMGALTPDKDLASTPDRNGWSESQEDSGAAMHLMHGVEDFVLGHTDQVHITAGTARHDVDPTKLDIVGPILRVFQGTTKSQEQCNSEHTAIHWVWCH